MKVLCKNCKKEIDVISLEEQDSEKTYSCSYCNAPFTIRPKVGSEGFDIVFNLDKRTIRNCINCGNKFYSLSAEAIPVCPVCKGKESPKEAPINMYHIIKSSGKRLGPYSLDEVGSWI